LFSFARRRKALGRGEKSLWFSGEFFRQKRQNGSEGVLAEVLRGGVLPFMAEKGPENIQGLLLGAKRFFRRAISFL
jgi:hypothetical protein